MITIPVTTKFRVYVYPTLALAMASTKVFEYGTIIMIKGDTTRFKLGVGSQISLDTPPAPTALPFASLPWFNAAANPATAYAAAGTGTLTAAQLAQRYITTTSAAATSLTLPTATLMGTQLGATAGTVFDFVVDNTAGANTDTVVVGTGITVGSGALTGSGTLTIPAGQVGYFRLFFTSATTALLYRTM